MNSLNVAIRRTTLFIITIFSAGGSWMQQCFGFFSSSFDSIRWMSVRKFATIASIRRAIAGCHLWKRFFFPLSPSLSRSPLFFCNYFDEVAVMLFYSMPDAVQSIRQTAQCASSHMRAFLWIWTEFIKLATHSLPSFAWVRVMFLLFIRDSICIHWNNCCLRSQPRLITRRCNRTQCLVSTACRARSRPPI